MKNIEILHDIHSGMTIKDVFMMARFNKCYVRMVLNGLSDLRREEVDAALFTISIPVHINHTSVHNSLFKLVVNDDI